MFVAPDPNVIIYGTPGYNSGMKFPNYFFKNIDRKKKIDNIFPKIGKKSLEPGYVFAPYILQTTTTPIIMEGGDKSYLRKSRINRLFNLGFEINGINPYIPKKSLTSRYARASIIANYYSTITITS